MSLLRIVNFKRASSSNATQLPPPPSQQRADGGRASSTSTRRSPLNSGLWISVEFVVTVAQIVAAIVVMVLAKDEHPEAPLFTWVVGYTSGCVATLLFSIGVFALITEAQAAKILLAWNNQVGDSLRTRLNGLVDHFKMAIDCFFAVWFVVGNVWIFGGPPLLLILLNSTVALDTQCLSYYLAICCCLPCLISVLGFRENFSQTRGATAEAINALPVYKFKLKSRNDLEFSEEGEGGFLLQGSEKKRLISGEDASCCICLARYGDDEEVRELPCLHVFHVDCVDKWLKINATCPLCKNEVGESSTSSSSS
ncbi:hypothetical protein Bca52824_053444 [Brassica carinata]|uniref:RING-type domain-containing protein n=1 Tax=Brassica carinata TaxID=52824 RepID=A0A8X7UKX8_BRACI|nr:hypothetical protein Bca52824_053444 [Brassica carinata]